jgi:hypothetical protein
MVNTGFGDPSFFSQATAKQNLFDLFAVTWQVQTYQRLCYLFLAVPMGIIYGFFLIIGIFFPITLIYLAIMRKGLLSPLFFSTVLIGILIWKFMPRFVNVALGMERFLARKFMDKGSLSSLGVSSKPSRLEQENHVNIRLPRPFKELFYLTFRIPMGFANLIIIAVSMLILVLMILAPWIYGMAGPDVIFAPASINTFPKALLVMTMVVPTSIVILRGLRSLAVIQGRFAIFMLAD